MLQPLEKCLTCEREVPIETLVEHIKVGEEVIFDHLFINNKRQILIDNGIHNISIAFLIECNALFQIYCV